MESFLLVWLPIEYEIIKELYNSSLLSDNIICNKSFFIKNLQLKLLYLSVMVTLKV